MNVRTIRPSELEHTGAMLYQVFARSAEARGYRPPWADEREARELITGYARAQARDVLVAEEGGAVIGVGAVRVRGEVASLGPIAGYVDGRGIGGALLDALLERADEAGALATRLYADAWNPSAFALYAGRGFSVVDVAAHIERKPGPSPDLGNSRGLEVRPFSPKDVDELLRFDNRLTGHERDAELAACVRLVARRHSSIVGYLGSTQAAGRTLLGPAVAVDASDLFTLIANALLAAGRGESWIKDDSLLHARLSTSAPAASMAALGLGFRVVQLGLVMSRGAPPPTRPPQLYALLPELL